MAFQILMVEDDAEICEVVEDFFVKKSGHEMELQFAADGESAFEMLYETEYDMVLLDVMLPQVSGFEICRYIRQNSICPIILVHAPFRRNGQGDQYKQSVEGL